MKAVQIWKQINVTKLRESEKAKVDSGKIYFDISTIKPRDGEEAISRND